MQLNLRKANKLRKTLAATAAAVIAGLPLGVRLTVHDPANFADPAAVLNTQQTVLTGSIEAARRLIGITYALRAGIAQANMTSGISTELTKQAMTEELLKLFDRALKGDTRPETAHLQSILAHVKKQFETVASDRYNKPADAVDVPVQTKAFRAQLEDIKRTLLKDKETINDRILALNVETLVEISDDDWKFLQEQKIV